MTDLLVGRAGTDLPIDSFATEQWGGQKVQLEGTFTAPDLASLLALRAQIVGLADEAAAVPIVAASDPLLSGFYTVDEANASFEAAWLSDGILQGKFSITATRVASSSAPLVESRIVAALRQKTLGGTNGPGITSGSITAWHAVPGTAQGYRAPSGAAVVTRAAESGTVRLYTGSGLLDAAPSWQQDPASFFDGAATLRVGAAADLPGVVVQTFGYAASVQSFTVPAGVTRVRIAAAGAAGGDVSAGGNTRLGGKGAVVTGEFAVTAGDTLHVTVGGAGSLQGGGLFAGARVGGAPGSGSGYPAGGGAPSRVTANDGSMLVVAAGGGGASVLAQGGRGGYNGQVGYGLGGGGGTQTGPGAGGDGSATAGGSPDASGIAAGGAGAPQAGGGGGGYYGGGGGGTGSLGFGSASGGGGGGSSHVAAGATSVSYVDGSQSGDGSVTITAIPSTGGAIPPVAVTRYVVVGRQAPAEPLGWEISNGLVRIRPGYDGTTAQLEIAGFDGTAWRAKTWQMWDKVTNTAVSARARAISVLRNAPEEVRLRWILDLPDNLNTVTVDLRVRRGARCAEITTQSTMSKRWGWMLVTSEAGTGITGAVVATANDSAGGRYIIMSPDSWTADTTKGGLALTTAGTAVTAGIGYVGGYASAQAADMPTGLVAQFMAAGAETMAVVAQ